MHSAVRSVVLALCLLLIHPFTASAQRAVSVAPAGVVSACPMNEADGQAGQSDPTGYTLSNATITGGERTLFVIVIGQSNAANDRPTKYTVTNTTKLRMLNPYDGNVYRLKDQQLGPNGSNGNMFTKVFDTLITNAVFGSVIVANVSRSGSGSRKWRGYRETRGTNFDNAQAVVCRARALGLFVPNADLSVAVQIAFGETDKTDGLTQAEWLTNVRDLRAGLVDAGLPSTAKWFVNVETLESNATSANVAAAQANIVDNVTYFAGGNLDSLTGATNRRADNTHFTDTGHDNAAALIVTAYDAVY